MLLASIYVIMIRKRSIWIIQGSALDMVIEWVNGFKIHVSTDKDEVIISANKEGLLSLAKQLTALAEGKSGDHIHYDDCNSLEDGSSGMIIEIV